jgi:hypothetical protein
MRRAHGSRRTHRSRLRKTLLTACMTLSGMGGIALVSVVSAPAAQAAATPTALILDSTVTVDSTANTGVGGHTCSNESVEQCDLEQQGYNVTVVSGTTWDAMTTAQFASYQLLVLGDPSCGEYATSGGTPSQLVDAVSNEATTWASVVNGNVLVIGTDPVLHYSDGVGHLGAGTLINDGLAFAGGQTAHTGLYLDLSCAYNSASAASHAPILDGIESGFLLTGSGTDSIDVVATNPFLTGLTNAGLSNWSSSVHEYMNAWPSDFVPIAIATSASSPVYQAPDGTWGDPYILGRGAGLAAGNISLTPASGSQTTGSNYTLTATVQSGGSPVVGTTVTFTCTSGPCTTSSGTGTTNGSGVATLTYSSTSAGTDTWTASFVPSGSSAGIRHAVVLGETSNSATVTWTSTVASPTITTTPSGSVPPGGSVSDSATLAGGTSPTGTITFRLFGPGDTTCETVISTTTGTLSGGTASSGNVTSGAPGTYNWVATYGGDTNNNTATSPCGSESVVVTNAPVILCGQQRASGTSVTPGGTATAAKDNTTATASGGEGTVTINGYPHDPVTAPAGFVPTCFFDVSLSPANTFTSLVINDCNPQHGTTFVWFNPSGNSGNGQWQSVVGDPGPTLSSGPPLCIDVTLDGTTSPNLSQLTGTVFAAAHDVSGLPSPPPPPVTPPPLTANGGYWLVASDGGIFNFGNAGFFGSTGAQTLNKPVVGMDVTPDGKGYWLVASDGGIFNYGDAGFFGSTGAQTLNKPVVGISSTPDGKGYWLVASDGGVFNYGDAGYFGSTGAQTLNKPIVGIAATADGMGYWLVASDGGVFSFGDAGYFGSTGAQTLNKPIVGIAATADGMGYWLVASDGGVFSFGDAGYFGSTGAQTLNKPIVGIAATPDGMGYRLVGSDGGVFSFGDAGFFGSMGGTTLNKPMVGEAANS